MIRPKTETEGLLLSITKNCQTLVQQTHRKPEETLDFKMRKPRETIYFNPPIHTKGDWMSGLIDLEVYNSIFNITEENNKFKLYTDTFDEFSFEELKDELEEILKIPNITDSRLEDETLTPLIIHTYQRLRFDKLSRDGYRVLLLRYSVSPFRDFESYLRNVAGLEEDNIQLILKQYNEKFITYDLDPGNYTIGDLQKAFYRLGGQEGTLQIEYDGLNKEVKLIFNAMLEERFGALRFDKKPFSHTLLKFEPYWDYKPTNSIHADSPDAYTSDKNILNLHTMDKIHLKCDCIDGSIQDGLRQPILFSFELDKPSGYKVFCEPETIHYKRKNLF